MVFEIDNPEVADVTKWAGNKTKEMNIHLIAFVFFPKPRGQLEF